MHLSIILLGLLSPTITLQSEPKSYTALGDSYASGDGAGSSNLLPNFDITCGRFSGAYPVQVANSSALTIAESGFQNLACGGASTVSVLRSQVPRISGDVDFVTVTVGGNEVDFFALLNACVHQWWVPLLGRSRACETEMVRARGLVQSSAFLNNFDNLVRGAVAKLKLKPDHHRRPRQRQLLVTGYATFFNDRTDQCDHVTFSRRSYATNFLTKQLRREFNQMVSMLNDVIRAAAEAHGAVYVDVDRLFEGHRFCEEGVVEPSEREETWFFNLKYDTAMSELGLRETSQLEQEALPGPIDDFFDLTKTFHPTVLGHEAIANEVVRLVLAGQGVINGAVDCESSQPSIRVCSFTA